MTVLQKSFLFLYGLTLSSLIGLIAFLFLTVEKILTHFLWETAYPNGLLGTLYPLILVGSSFLLLYSIKKFWGPLPKTTHDLIHELKERQTVSYQQTWKSLLAALVILSAGAGVGPEAPLLGAVIAYSIWQADKLRYIAHHMTELQSASWPHRIRSLFHPSQYLMPYDPHKILLSPQAKRLWIGILSLNGLLVTSLLLNATDSPSFITHLGNSTWSLQELLYLLPLMLYGVLVGKLYAWLRRHCLAKFKQLTLPLGLQLACGGIAIIIISFLAPSLLFSGQHSMEFLATEGLSQSFATLMILSFGKLIFLDLCLGSGWTGGDIFPVTFATILQGFAITHISPQLDPLFVVLVVSITMSFALLDNTWIAAIFISLFFPSNLWFISFLIVILYLFGTKQFVNKNSLST